jgi:epoxyqueuosine reductase
MSKELITPEESTDAAAFVAGEIQAFVRQSPLNRLPGPESACIFDEPLVQFASGADPIFTEYKAIIAPSHLTPREALALGTDASPRDLPARLSVISWVLPISPETRQSNHDQKKLPSRAWSHTRWFGEKFNIALRTRVVEVLKGRGYLAAAPALPQFLKIFSNYRGMYSSWSERHIAYAAGLGTFSLSDGFISDCGIAHRCGSVVTSLELPASPRTARGTYANCLFYTNVGCGLCIQRCPAGAITSCGHDKIKCHLYLREIGYKPNETYDIEKSVAGCGLCQTGVPCESVNPVAKLSKKSA